MKEKISRYKSSVQARKQRKFRALAPLHLRRKMMSANLSKELRKKYLKRSIPLIKGDSVRIMRGEFKNKKGKVLNVNKKKLKVYIEGIQRSKKDGTKINVPFDPSNLQIIELNLEDKKRIQALERKGVRK
ncbi:MAG: 50S ribosomal protein L24 [Candidatus Pacearchaeota archaeon]